MGDAPAPRRKIPRNRWAASIPPRRKTVAHPLPTRPIIAPPGRDSHAPDSDCTLRRLRVVPVDPLRTIVHRHHHRDAQRRERRKYPGRQHHHHQSADQQAGHGRDGCRGPLHVAAPAPRRVSRRRGPAGLPPRGTHRHRPDQLDGGHRLQPRSRRAHRRGRSPGRRHAARDEQRHRRQARRQPPHPRAAAEHPQRLFADLPDAGRGRLDRQQLQLDELQRQRRAADDDGHGDRRGDRLLPHRQRLHGHFGVPLGRRDPGVQGARRELSRRVRPQPRQRAERRLQVRHQPVPRQRLRVLPRLGARFEQLFREACRNAARRFPAQPVRRRRRRTDPAGPHLLHDVVRRPARTAAVADDDQRADAGTAAGGLLADLRPERPADSGLRSVLDAREPGGRIHPRSVRGQQDSRRA